jgi:hypothetical protein
MILFGADQLSIWCAPIVWLVLTDFKLVLTDFPVGRDRFFRFSLSIHNATIANNLVCYSFHLAKILKMVYDLAFFVLLTLNTYLFSVYLQLQQCKC